MIINWLGHSFFKIETQNNVIAIDPFNEEKVGIKPSRFKASILLSTHDHMGHNNLDLIMGDPFILKTPGEIEINDIFIKGIESSHNGVNNDLVKNTIFIIDSEEIKIVHLGDYSNRKIKDSLLEKLSNVDILLLPISDKKNGKLVEEAGSIVKQIEPKIVIPMHYDPKKEKDVLDKFIKEVGSKPEELDKLNIRKNSISEDEDSPIQLIILQN
jgi:L-ascorbate metabolism protein UlaG (beta-lactamase superfamily)